MYSSETSPSAIGNKAPHFTQPTRLCSPFATSIVTMMYFVRFSRVKVVLKSEHARAYASMVALAREDSDPATFTAGSTTQTVLCPNLHYMGRGKAAGFSHWLAALLRGGARCVGDVVESPTARSYALASLVCVAPSYHPRPNRKTASSVAPVCTAEMD